MCCRTPRSFPAIIGRCDLNSKAGQEYIAFCCRKGYLLATKDGERNSSVSTDHARDFIELFTELYQKLFDRIPGFRL